MPLKRRSSFCRESRSSINAPLLRASLSPGPARRRLEPQLAPVPAGLRVSRGALLERAAAVPRALVGLPAALLPAAVPAARSLPEPGPVLARRRPLLPQLPAPEPAGRMGGPAAAGRGRGADGRRLGSAGAAAGVAAAAVRPGAEAGLRRSEAARRAAALGSPGAGARDGRRTAARAARHGGRSGECYSRYFKRYSLKCYSCFFFCLICFFRNLYLVKGVRKNAYGISYNFCFCF